ncbi:MAG: efflux RND transporter permease subunit [Nitrospirota bacterium]|nr:efflux RND transporter permease subunit [Nitrospirota bacterium]
MTGTGEFLGHMIRRPVAVTVGVLLVVLIGSVALFRLPVQLTPEVIKPSITVETNWRGASPREVERELVIRQEEVLRGTPGMVEMESEARDSQASVTLTFATGTDMDAALIKVSNRLNQVKDSPDEAERPVLYTVNANQGAIAWLVLRPDPDNPSPVGTYQNFAVNVIKGRFERIPGVGQSNVFGGWEQELQIIADAEKLAARDITLPDLARAIHRENQDTTAGSIDEGKRSITVRVTGAYTSPEDLRRVVVSTASGAPLFLGDLAEVRLGYRKPARSVRQNGHPAIAVNVIRESGSNTLEIMRQVKQAAAELNAGPLAERGLTLTLVYDEGIYIEESLHQVWENLIVGGILAIGVLLLFLRSVSSTVVVAAAIPVSVIGTFGMLWLLDRNLNVVSMAGMCFAVGMVVDDAIVVLENIFRHREMGKSRMDAALDGVGEVWGAVLAATLTKVAVFLPIIFLDVEAGQMFRDIALAVVTGITLSLFVSVTVIPTFAGRVLGGAKKTGGEEEKPLPLQGVTDWGSRAADWIANASDRLCANNSRRWTALGGTAVLVAGLMWLSPQAEYLPEGNRNLVMGILLPPPGYNVEEIVRIGNNIENDLRPLWEAERELDGKPAIENFFYVASGRQVFMGVRTKDEKRIREIIPVMKEALGKIPGMIAIVQQSSVFARGLGSGRSVDVEFSGPELETLVALGGRTFGMMREVLPGAQTRPKPSLDIGEPEIRVEPDRLRAADVGLPLSDLSLALSAMVDGATVSKYAYEGEEIDVALYATPGTRGAAPDSRTEDPYMVAPAPLSSIKNLPLRTAHGATVTLDSVSRVWETSGPTQINHIERRRAVVISAVPPNDVSLEAAMQAVQDKIVTPLKKQGAIQPPYAVRLAGTVDELQVTMQAMKWNLLLATLITFLLIAALFESFLYSLVIMIAVPTAAAGGVLGLVLVDALVADQRLDVLTMIGFMILVGTVVNNSILIVHQGLIFIRRDGMSQREALHKAVRVRVRPIFMSTLTTVMGMFPLILMTGSGSELYRGIGSVVVGGLALSTLFTLGLVPVLFSLLMDLKHRILGGSSEPSPPAP